MAKTSFVNTATKIKVIGLGGAGCNAVTRMVREQSPGVEFIAMNTDARHLSVAEAAVRIQLGERITHGLGAGGDHVLGQKAAEESRDEIKHAVATADMVFITAGMGAGTGTASYPLVAELSRQSCALTLAKFTKPYSFEGTRRRQVAEEGIGRLLDKVDTLIIIPNDRLLGLCDSKTSLDNAFRMADEVLFRAVQAIAGVVTVPGLINLDFADIRAVMKDAGPAWMSIGRGSGKNWAIDAAKDALSSPLLDVSVNRAKAILINFAGSSDLTLFEINDAAKVIKQAVDPEANVILGVVVDPSLSNEVRLTLIATGFGIKMAPSDVSRGEENARFPEGLIVKRSLTFPPSCGSGVVYLDSGLTRQAQGATEFAGALRKEVLLPWRRRRRPFSSTSIPSASNTPDERVWNGMLK